MGVAIAAVKGLGVTLQRKTALTVGVLAVGVVVLALGSVVALDAVPVIFLGGASSSLLLWVAPFLLYPLGVGTMYAVVTVDRPLAVGALLRDRLLSVLGVGLAAAGIVQAAITLGILCGVVLVLLAPERVLDLGEELNVGALEFFVLLTWLLFSLFAGLCAVWFPLVLPGIVLDGRSVSAAIDAALSAVRLSPVSVAGFTLLRVAVQYGPAGLAVTGVWAARRAGAGGTPAFEGALTDINLSDPSVFLLVAAGLVVGQVLRIPYTVEFYRRVSVDGSKIRLLAGDAESGGPEPGQ